MLDDLQSLVAEVTRRLKATVASTFYTQADITTAVQQSYVWAAGVYNWPQLEKAKRTDTRAGYYYYDYPSKFLTDSISRLIVNGKKYKPTKFEDFLNYKHKINTTESGRYIYADYNRQYFIDPEPTEDNLDIFVFGLEMPAPLENNGDVTFFTNSEPLANEAIIKKAISILLPKSEKKLAQTEEAEALNILANTYSKILKRQDNYHTLNRPAWEVPDFFPRRGTRNSRIGNFD